jgi:hypothetical protein
LRIIAIAQPPVSLSCKETPFRFPAIVADPTRPGQPVTKKRALSFDDADRHHDHRVPGEHELILREERRLVIGRGMPAW